MNILYVPIYPGELGWEIINYVPHVNYLCEQKKYDEIHIVVRPGREALYPMGTHFYPTELRTDKSMGNNGPAAPKNKIHKTLANKGHVDSVVVPTGGCKYVKHRKFIKYKATDAYVKKWDHLPNNTVTLLVRGRNFGTHKNWETANWIRLCEYLVGKGKYPVITGMKESIVFDAHGCMNLQGCTTMGDMLAIMQKSNFVIGQSTGPAHFASLAGVPHAIWGSSRIRERYESTWNPHKTMVEYCSCPTDFCCSFEHVRNLVDRMIGRLNG